MPVKPKPKGAPFDYGTKDLAGMYENYPCLPDADRKPVQPVRDRYRHLTCGTVTYMHRKLAETYAAQPDYYSHTYCAGCHDHLPVAQFVWVDDGEPVGGSHA